MTGTTCFALSKQDATAVLCQICNLRKQGKAVREKCHRKQHRTSCDCPICIQHGDAATDEQEKQQPQHTKRQRNQLDYSPTVQKMNSDSFFVGKGKLQKDVVADMRIKMAARKAKGKSHRSSSTDTGTPKTHTRKRSRVNGNVDRTQSGKNIKSKKFVGVVS